MNYAIKITIALVISFTIINAKGENPNFNYESYIKIDFDSLIDNTQKAKMYTSNESGKNLAFDFIEFNKISFIAYLISTPAKIDIKNEFGPMGNIYQKQLKAYGVSNPPELNFALKIKTLKGKEIVIVMQDVLVDALLSEGKENDKMEIYGWHYMNDADGPLIVMAEFSIIQASSKGSTHKKKAVGIGYGKNFGKSTGTNDIDSLLDDLFDSTKTNKPKFTKGGALKGKRSKKNIMKTVMVNLSALRFMYNKRLKEKPKLKGRVTVKFRINNLGKVITCKVVSSTTNDRKFERNLTKKIIKWNFGEIPFPNDTTEVVYPFVFAK